jgi:hypothetical protein
MILWRTALVLDQFHIDTFHTMSSTWRGGDLLKIRTSKNIHSKGELGLLHLREVILAETLQLVPLLQFK